MRRILSSIVVCLCLSACVPEAKPPPRESVRAGVVFVARVVKLLDQACAGAALSSWEEGKQELALKEAKICETAYDTARDALLVAQEAVDAYTEAANGNIGCLFAKSLRAIELQMEALKALGVTGFPPEVDDAMKIAKIMSALTAGQCSR